jgi:hypothetical protein
MLGFGKSHRWTWGIGWVWEGNSTWEVSEDLVVPSHYHTSYFWWWSLGTYMRGWHYWSHELSVLVRFFDFRAFPRYLLFNVIESLIWNLSCIIIRLSPLLGFYYKHEGNLENKYACVFECLVSGSVSCQAICKIISETAHPYMKEYGPKFKLESIEFDSLTLGTLPPTFSGKILYWVFLIGWWSGGFFVFVFLLDFAATLDWVFKREF